MWISKAEYKEMHKDYLENVRLALKVYDLENKNDQLKKEVTELKKILSDLVFMDRTTINEMIKSGQFTFNQIKDVNPPPDIINGFEIKTMGDKQIKIHAAPQNIEISIQLL